MKHLEHQKPSYIHTGRFSLFCQPVTLSLPLIFRPLRLEFTQDGVASSTPGYYKSQKSVNTGGRHMFAFGCLGPLGGDDVRSLAPSRSDAPSRTVAWLSAWTVFCVKLSGMTSDPRTLKAAVMSLNSALAICLFLFIPSISPLSPKTCLEIAS
ncbi:hypothetical protein B0T13DRAFT_467189 [Neurospora crassa]|nr:hypothetical protein B0T13DRAFT_467189 [Neurospora crassa]